MLVPTLDEERALPLLFARLLDAPAEDRADEVVIADGGSSDRTRAIAEERGCALVHSAAGRGRQLAAGARRIASELLVVLHADCVPEPGSLAALRRAFADPALELAAFHQRIDAPERIFRAIERAADLRCARFGLVYGDSGLCVRRALYESVGGFRELALFEDVDLSRRLARRARVALVPGAHLRVSARRWRSEGPLRCTARNWMLTAGYLAGIAPERLARWYRPHAANPATKARRAEP